MMRALRRACAARASVALDRPRASRRLSRASTSRVEAKKGFLFGEVEDLKSPSGGDSSSGKSVRWSEPLAIAKYPAPCLRAKNAPIEAFDENLEALSKAMFKIMYETIGCGLAAPQVGVNYRMMVYNEAGEPGKGKEVVLCNPKIVKYSKETDFFEEGCLSFPKMYADVEVRSDSDDARAKEMPMSDQKINIR
jgi:peptide deformylase